MVDLAPVVHSAHASLLKKHNGERAGSKLFMKLDVEGSEASILPHLVLTIDSIKIDGTKQCPTGWLVFKEMQV